MVVCAVAKTRPGGEVYLVVWKPEHVETIYRDIEAWLRDDELEFDWLDAAEMEAVVRDVMERVE